MIDLVVIFDSEAEYNALTIDKTAYVTNGDKFMCLCRFRSPSDIPESINVLGTYNEIFDSEEKSGVYFSIYSNKYTYYDIDGNEVVANKPDKFCVYGGEING